MHKSSNETGSVDPVSNVRYHFNIRGYGSHQAIADLIKPDSYVLDVGCASGYLMHFLSETKGCHGVGIEIDPMAVVKARELGFHVIHADVRLGLRAARSLGPFGHIIFGDVLEHLPDPLVVLRETLNLVAGDGGIVVSLPNILSLVARIRLLRGSWQYEDTGIFDRTHLRFFSIKSGRDLVKGSGYRIDQEVFVGPLTFYGGRPLRGITALRPGILANQMIFAASPLSPQGRPHDVGSPGPLAI